VSLQAEQYDHQNDRNNNRRQQWTQYVCFVSDQVFVDENPRERRIHNVRNDNQQAGQQSKP